MSGRRERLDALHKEYLSARTPAAKDGIWRDILALDKQGPYTSDEFDAARAAAPPVEGTSFEIVDMPDGHPSIYASPEPTPGLREALVDAMEAHEDGRHGGAYPHLGQANDIRRFVDWIVDWMEKFTPSALAASPAPEPDVDEAGLPITHDAHSRDWFEGYAAGRAEAPEPTGLAAYQRGVGDAAHLMRCSCGEQGYDFECAICGDYSAQGVEVHESCLEMLSRGGAAAPEPTGLDVERKRSFVNFVRMWWRGPNGFPVVPAGSDAVADEDFEDMERKLAEIGIALAARLTDSGATDGE